MATSLIYKSASVYELVMVMLYGRHYPTRFRAIADLIPESSSVLDLCCGPAHLYHRYLKPKRVSYRGLDVNKRFVAQLEKRGAKAEVWDLRRDAALPEAEYVIMQASLYHFLPDASAIVNRMIEAATRQIIIAEPVRNLASSKSRLVSLIGRILTNPGSGDQPHRFTEQSLDLFFESYRARVNQRFLIAGGREKVYVLDK